jgi:hypothetical protein
MSRTTINELYGVLGDRHKDYFLLEICNRTNVDLMEFMEEDLNGSAINRIAALEEVQRELNTMENVDYFPMMYSIVVKLLVICQSPVDINLDIIQMAMIYRPDIRPEIWKAIREEAIEQAR